MFDYNIAKSYDIEAFKRVCNKIEETLENLSKDKALIDVDTSVIQIYYIENEKIKVICDIEVDAVWVESAIELPFLNDI